jgi:hypothetical protein
MATRKAQKWSDLSSRQQTGMVIGGLIQLALAATAWADLARRPADRVNGPKGLWAVLIAVNFVGPLSYFVLGRKRA